MLQLRRLPVPPLRRVIVSKRWHSIAPKTHIVPKKGDRVVVAMSGGVDSSVTARLLAEKDYDLSAVFMRNWDTRDESGTDNGCEWEKDWEDVQQVCRMIGLPCEMIDLSREYWNRVFEPSLSLWEQGETPNPDVWCNREIKFGALIDSFLEKRNISWLATGHYAGVDWVNTDCGPRPRLVRAVDRTKDQTYYLSGVRESSLRKTMFPLRFMAKKHVRELAVRFNLPTASREESMGICFVGEKRKFDHFLSQYLSPKPGRIYDAKKERYIGTHQGLWHYTIGQNARIPGMPERMLVSKKVHKTNELFVVPASCSEQLEVTLINTREFQWIWQGESPITRGPISANVQIRHRMSAVPCTISLRDNHPSSELSIKFDEPQPGVSPGQIAAVFDMKNEWCMGSGIISSSIT